MRLNFMLLALFKWTLVVVSSLGLLGACQRSTDHEANTSKLVLSIPSHLSSPISKARDSLMKVKNLKALGLRGGGFSSAKVSSATSLLFPEALARVSQAKLDAAIMGVGVLAHLVVNVTGPGIPQPILYIWDGCQDHCDSQQVVVAPADITLDIPTGENRLIQVLAVYTQEGGSQSVMDFYYGDASQALSKVSETITIPIDFKGNSSSGSGVIVGRYLTGPNQGPTGTVLMKYKPDQGRPPMLIQGSPIVSGWFSVFGLNNISFVYELPGGGDLFGGGKALDDFDSLSSDKIVSVRLPEGLYRAEETGYDPTTNTSTVQYTDSMESHFVYGWFASSPEFLDGKRICLDRAVPSGDISSLIFHRIGHYDPSLGSFTPLPFSEIQSLFNGVSDCTASDREFENVLKLKPLRWDGQGKEAAQGFTGIFRSIPSNFSGNDGLNESSFQVTADPSSPENVKLNWSLLPGIRESSGLVQVEFYRQVLSQSPSNFSGGYDSSRAPCREASEGALDGFSPLKVATPDVEEILFPLPMDERNRTNLLVCPKFTSGEYLGGAFIPYYMFTYLGGNFTSPTPDPYLLPSQVRLDGMTALPGRIPVGNCLNLSVALVNGYGVEASLGEEVSLDLSLSSNPVTPTTGSFQIYSGQNCLTALPNNRAILPSGTSSVWISISTPYETPLIGSHLVIGTSHLTPTTSGLVGPSVSFDLVDGGHSSFDIHGPKNLVPGICYPITILNKNYFGYFGTTATSVLAVLDGGAWGIYSDGACQNPISQTIPINMMQGSIPSITGMSSASYVQVYLKMPSGTLVSSGMPYTLTLSDGNPPPTSPSIDSISYPYFSASGGTAPVGVRLRGPGNINAYACGTPSPSHPVNPFTVELINSDGNVIPTFNSNITVSLSTEVMKNENIYTFNSFHKSLDCLDPSISTIDIPIGSYEQIFFPNLSFDGDYTVKATASFNSGGITQTFPMVEQPLHVNGFNQLQSVSIANTLFNNNVCAYPNVWVSGTSSGSGVATLPQNSPIQLRLKLNGVDESLYSSSDNVCSTPLSSLPSSSMSVNSNAYSLAIKVRDPNGVSGQSQVVHYILEDLSGFLSSISFDVTVQTP